MITPSRRQPNRHFACRFPKTCLLNMLPRSPLIGPQRSIPYLPSLRLVRGSGSIAVDWLVPEARICGWDLSAAFALAALPCRLGQASAHWLGSAEEQERIITGNKPANFL